LKCVNQNREFKKTSKKGEIKKGRDRHVNQLKIISRRKIGKGEKKGELLSKRRKERN